MPDLLMQGYKMQLLCKIWVLWIWSKHDKHADGSRLWVTVPTDGQRRQKVFFFFPFMYSSSGNSGLNLHKYVSFFLSLLCGSEQLSCLWNQMQGRTDTWHESCHKQSVQMNNKTGIMIYTFWKQSRAFAVSDEALHTNKQKQYNKLFSSSWQHHQLLKL